MASPEKDCGASPDGHQPQGREGQVAPIYQGQIMPEQPDCFLRLNDRLCGKGQRDI